MEAPDAPAEAGKPSLPIFGKRTFRGNEDMDAVLSLFENTYVGQIDEEALFYLRSRGIPEKEARAMLMYAFANDVIENVKIPELKEKINCIIAEKLGVTINTKP